MSRADVAEAVEHAVAREDAVGGDEVVDHAVEGRGTLHRDDDSAALGRASRHADSAAVMRAIEVRPVVETRLPEDAQRRIPRRYVVLQSPAPATVQAFEQPYRLAQCAPDVCDRGIRRDDEIELGEKRRRVAEIPDRGAVSGDAVGECAEDRGIAGRTGLDRMERDAGHVEKGESTVAAGSTCDA